jgi:DNA-directed RNA polymerase specialized sigma24 family protein
MLMAAAPSQHLPIAEVRRRVMRIARADIVRLSSLAGFYAMGLGSDAPDELLGEAIARALEGRRRWPRNVGIVPFFAGVMKSVAGEWRDKACRDPLHRIGAEIGDEAALPRDEGHEQVAAVHLLIEKIRRHLGNDPLLFGLFELRLTDKSPSEIQAALRLDSTTLDTAMHRLKRRLIEIFPDGYPL